MNNLENSARASSAQSARVLIVEDDADFASALSISLGIEEYFVHAVGSVKEAQEYLRRETVDLLILDWHLPDGTGAEVCLAARQSQPSVPILAISGLGETRAQAIEECRPNIYLDKPISFTELYSHMRALLAL